ncbi:asparagine synthase-related protein [Streptomyces camelliae]|uniref:Asparagine synthase-related protein n=1 Tax=Streptomyces camelliae TaxID=3004093 RepID=A0ABY7P1A9_9ACTN|nr:asparagine synthase-related protein [Streptomyces sp. HUAS 2-6]WBO64095.1 asparagine synthase-related protein [Streptomyces sp. HUAS 2-6]
MSAIDIATATMTCEVRSEGVALVEFSQSHEQNPFSRARMRELTRLMLDLDGDERVRCVVLYGGAARSFGAGGGFHEVSEFSGGDEADAWIDDITDLSSTIAGITNLTETRDEADPLAAFRAPRREDPLAAGEAQIEALTEEIRRIDAATPEGTGYATLLSGGIDSGTVTYLAATSGLSVTPYSVATPWGDELADAAELCAELGIALEPVELAEGQIIASIPEAVRRLGGTEPEVVEVALTATSVQRLRTSPPRRCCSPATAAI